MKIHIGKKCGIIEVKCPEQFKEVDPKHVSLVSERFCLQVSEDGELKINKDHPYYDQIQHQLAMTGCHFCDFVVHTFKGTTIIEFILIWNTGKSFVKRSVSFILNITYQF